MGKAVAVRRPPSHTIAMLVSQIGWQAGPWQRRLGVAAMKARAAHQQLAGVLRSRAEMPRQRFCSCGILKDRIEEEGRLKHWHSCHLPVLDHLFLTGAGQ